MEKIEKFNKIKYYEIDFIAVMIILVLGIYCWKEMDIIAVFGDEFGYWGNAAILAGYNWKPLMEKTAYYSIGYSLLILPLFLIKNYAMKYHLAIILNIILTIGCYFCAKYITVRIFKEENKLRQACSSLISVLTVNVIVQMRIAWDEILICFLMWFSICLMINIHESYRIYKLVAISLVLIYMVMTHQRTLPIVLLFISIMLAKYKSIVNWKKSIFFLVMFLILYIGYKYIKSFQIASIYSNSASSNLNNYTISSNFLKGYLYELFTNCKAIIISLWAKFVIYNISTGFTFLLTSIIAVKSFFTKTGEESCKYNVIRYIWLSGVIMLCLTAVQASGSGRADLIVYTRYFDFTIGPMILIGINYLGRKKDYCKAYVLLSLVFCLLSVGKIYDLIYAAEDNFNYICSPIMAGNILWFDKFMESINIVTALTIKIILLVGIFIFLYIKKRSNKVIIIVTTSIMILNTLLANHTSDAINGWREFYREDMILLTENIDKSNTEIYFMIDEDNLNYLNLMKELQYVLCDKTITTINEDELLDVLSDECYIITTEKYDRKNFKLIISSNIHKANLYYIKER